MKRLAGTRSCHSQVCVCILGSVPDLQHNILVSISVFSQPIVSRAKPEMLKSHFIPTMEKLKKRTAKVVAEEEHLRMEGKSEGDEEEGTIRDEFAVLCRDLYALYPLLIRYVDNNRYFMVPV